MKSVLTLSCRRSCKSMDWFLYDRDLRHERVNTLLLGNIFLDCDKIIEIYASKYLRRMLLIDSLCTN